MPRCKTVKYKLESGFFFPKLLLIMVFVTAKRHRNSYPRGLGSETLWLTTPHTWATARGEVKLVLI